MVGKTLGHYQITNQLGRGGMGEVFQAKDQVLGREVAIKVLPDEFAKDADRVARFQREAKVLASLNHPNIAAIHGLEQSEGKNFLVLELVEGDTLAERLKHGQIPAEESLKIGIQIAEALEAAHEKGVIHRDLKPSNIKVTPDGKVKVLDFGLAKAYAGEQEEQSLSASPTLSNLATQQGVILGTAAYMSPEQARGKNVDKRADIWAFGCLVFEMLTGQAAFQGEDVTEILAAVVKGGANLDLLPVNIHPRVREVITRCLQKDLKRRYSTITDARYEIEQALADPGGLFVQQATAVKARRRLRLGLPWVAAVFTLGLIIAGVAVWRLKPPEPRQVTRFYHELPGEQQLSTSSQCNIAISPDGRQLIYSTNAGIFLRSMDELEPKLVPGTGEKPEALSFSPDGRWLCYSSGQLKKISTTGGTPVTLTEGSPTGFLNWGSDDTIVYSVPSRGIMRLPSNGGKPEEIVKFKNEYAVSPQLLPDGKSVLFGRIDKQPNMIVVQSLKSGERKELFAGNDPRYLPTGHIVYAIQNENSLFGVPFDLKTLETKGGHIPVVEGVFRAGGAPQWAVSDTGTLVYVPGTKTSTSSKRTLVWVDRKGKEEPIAAPPNAYNHPRISPDGTRVALTVAIDGNEDVWIWDFVRKTLTRLTFNKERDYFPLWTADGKGITFHNEERGILWKAADGTGQDELIGSLPDRALYPSSWSGDGKALVLSEGSGATDDIGMISMEGDHKYSPLLRGKHDERNPQISPNGRWMAYTSDESGRSEIYVRAFPEVDKGGRWQVSTSGGEHPLWSRNGRELFYRNGDTVMGVSVKTDLAFSLETPQVLFKGTYCFVQDEDFSWDISPDGRRFLMIKELTDNAQTPAGASPRRINIVLNWFEELKQRVPLK